jgi:hypothetical protein
MDTRGTSQSSAAQLRQLEEQGAMTVDALMFLVASSPEGEASAADMRQLAASGLLAPALRHLERGAAAGAAAAAAAAAAAQAGVRSSMQVPCALVLLGDKVFVPGLKDVWAACDEALSAASAASSLGVLSRDAALQLLNTCLDSKQAVVQCNAANAPPELRAFYSKCAALQEACAALCARQQRGEEKLFRPLVAAVRCRAQYLGASTAAVEAALQGAVRVITLYPRCMWAQEPGLPNLTEDQGGYASLQQFLQEVVSAVQVQEVGQQQLLRLQQLAAAAPAVFKAAPEHGSMCKGSRGSGCLQS